MAQAFSFWERETRGVPQAQDAAAQAGRQELHIDSWAQVLVDTTALYSVRVVERFYDGVRHYSLARLDLGETARAVISLLERAAAAERSGFYGQALRLTVQAVQVSPVLELGGAAFDSLAGAASLQALGQLAAIRVEIVPRQVNLSASDTQPLRLGVRLTVRERPLVGVWLAATFGSGYGSLRTGPPTDSGGWSHVDVVHVARSGRPAVVRIEPDLRTLVGDTAALALLPLPSAVGEAVVRTLRTRIGLFPSMSDSIEPRTAEALDCVTGELARTGYALHRVAGSARELPVRAGAPLDVLVEVAARVRDALPITLTRQQASATIRLVSYRVRGQTTVVAVSVQDVRGTGVTPDVARDAAIQRACREAVARLMDQPGWDVPE